MADEKTGIPLLRTKLHRPRVARNHYHRQHLLDRLDQCLQRPLMLVSAPAGYGKSTLLACWLEACDIPSAWVSLDKNDNNLHLFLAYFLDAVQTLFPAAGQNTEALLNAPNFPPLTVLAHSLINDLDQINHSFTLVLDDCHAISDKTVHGLIAELLSVLWPGQTDGLSGKEVTVAEVLSEVGYNTAMWGKWHLGEEPEHLPESQGYAYAYYGLWNGAPDNWPGSYDLYKDAPSSHKAMFYDFPGEEEYLKRTGIDLSVAGYVGRKDKGRKPIEGVAGKLGPDRQEAFEAESIKQITAYIKDKANDDNPFFIYWATYTQQLQGSKAHHNDKHVDKVNAQASEMAAHNAHMKQLLDTLKAEGIAENTLVVWISDNGPMYAFYPNSGYSWLKGGKGDVTEGGVRVPAMAWWPGMIAPNQDPVDILNITDLFTTAARLGGALDNIPDDRITDGIDQTALLLLGEDHGRRNTMFHYSGGVLGAIRYEDFKVHITEGHGGLPGMDFYNVMRDPGEKYGELYPGLFAVTPIQITLRKHMKMIEKFPHRVSEITPKGAELTPHD